MSDTSFSINFEIKIPQNVIKTYYEGMAKVEKERKEETLYHNDDLAKLYDGVLSACFEEYFSNLQVDGNGKNIVDVGSLKKMFRDVDLSEEFINTKKSMILQSKGNKGSICSLCMDENTKGETPTNQNQKNTDVRNKIGIEKSGCETAGKSLDLKDYTELIYSKLIENDEKMSEFFSNMFGCDKNSINGSSAEKSIPEKNTDVVENCNVSKLNAVSETSLKEKKNVLESIVRDVFDYVVDPDLGGKLPENFKNKIVETCTQHILVPEENKNLKVYIKEIMNKVFENKELMFDAKDNDKIKTGKEIDEFCKFLICGNRYEQNEVTEETPAVKTCETIKENGHEETPAVKTCETIEDKKLPQKTKTEAVTRKICEPSYDNILEWEVKQKSKCDKSVTTSDYLKISQTIQKSMAKHYDADMILKIKQAIENKMIVEFLSGTIDMSDVDEVCKKTSNYFCEAVNNLKIDHEQQSKLIKTVLEELNQSTNAEHDKMVKMALEKIITYITDELKKN